MSEKSIFQYEKYNINEDSYSYKIIVFNVFKL